MSTGYENSKKKFEIINNQPEIGVSGLPDIETTFSHQPYLLGGVEMGWIFYIFSNFLFENCVVIFFPVAIKKHDIKIFLIVQGWFKKNFFI